MKKLLQYPVAILFMGFILVFSVLNFSTPSKAFSEMENRYLQQLPAFSWRALFTNAYTPKFETYVNDQFIFRDGWITLKSVAEAGIGKIENNGIVYGSDHYLFEKLTSYDEKQLQKNTDALDAFVEKYPDMDTTLMLVPSAYSVLTDKVPKGLPNIDQKKLIGEIYAGREGVRTIDVGEALSRHKNDPIYYRTDHHWTSMGAYLAYQELADRMGWEAVSLDGLAVHTKGGFYGTHYSKAKLFNAVPDTITWYDVPVTDVTIDGKPSDGLYDLQKLETRDKYAMFLYGNNGVTVVENENAPSDQTLLVLKDSYANCFVPFLSQSVKKLVVVDLRSLPTPLGEVIQEYQIDQTLILYSFSNFASDTSIVKMKY